jgi:hypothetical protein
MAVSTVRAEFPWLLDEGMDAPKMCTLRIATREGN